MQKFAPSQVCPSQTEFCCSSNTEDLSSIQYINTLCLSEGILIFALVFSVKYTNQMKPFQSKFKRKKND